MAPPAWLPPLNSHENSVVHVKTWEYPVPDYFRNLEIKGIEIKRKFFIELHVYVDFYSENDVNKETVFPGLSVRATKSINVKNPESLAASLREDFLNEVLIPFPLDSCFWTEQHLHGCPSPWIHLSGEDELVDRILNFVLFVDFKPENDDLKLVAASLEIRKSVMVPEEEFESWVSWYDEQIRAYPNFEVEYRKAIGKPRDASEVFQEAMSLMARRSARRSLVGELQSLLINGDDDEGGDDSASKKSCSICLEEFWDRARVTRLPCRHMFHEDCIVRWLSGNHVCPLCRHQLPLE
ncbi:hypothetical protein Pfo_024264 [Paulownia fortunei]|nr:hypothetical protein Pfo_024264 [Paulownia fortunei]